MATISENLQTLNEAKAAIKTAIENKGVDLTDVPFTEYAEKIEAAPRSIKKYLDAGGSFKNTGIVDFTNIIDYTDTKDLTSVWALFENSYSTEKFVSFSTDKCTEMSYLFSGCSKVKELPFLDTSRAKQVAGTFRNCVVLEIVPPYDFRQVENISNCFSNLQKVTEIWVKNIKANLQVGSGDAYGHLLTLESLIHLIKELRDTGSLKTLTVGNVNLEKIANIYVRTIDITDEMRAEDDLIDEKLPFEVCESTDEGAMLITDYVALKNWSIA